MEITFSKKDRILGSIIYGAMALIGKLPAWWHYGVSNIVALLLHKVVGYRLEVVREQLLRSYPHKSDEERARIERDIYIHLSDLFVEYFMIAGFGSRTLRKHVILRGEEQIEALHEKGHRLVYLTLGHYGNWEWFTGFQDFLPFTQMSVLYKPLKGVMNYVMYRIRSKFGTKLIDKTFAPRAIMGMSRSESNQLLIFVADQTPSPQNVHLFTNFLNRDTAVFTGMERLAQKTKSPICYLRVERSRRGRYVCTVEVLTEDASTHEFGELSALFMHRLENSINANPALWLWTHKRWKYGEKEVLEFNPYQEFKRL
ncbi:lysophospholipid acyltransferase family protein [Porphyromonas sp.]|uniref:lysophospholipid acyltransferase family protein n=1 Tax=Porphyromonas sp. TaxID=1924944 RepID=UPI0026DCA99C|nr:lysophospholipid acyltransferase family protein [Porphyromonas sp.]MDO4771154.1 lysophospholipid acyltransferase family protein [Porphyromonas sp.]